MSTEKVTNEHSGALDCYLPFDWIKPSDIQEMICNHCCLSNVVLVGEDQPYSDQHWQCEKCDSTFANWIYPLSLGQRCELWNRHICEHCDWIGQGVVNGRCRSCSR